MAFYRPNSMFRTWLLLDMCIKYQNTEKKESIKREGREQMHTCAHTQATSDSLGMDVFI